MSALGELVDWCEQTACRQLLVRQRGETIVDTSFQGEPSDTLDVGSVQKSLVSFVVGILVGRGDLDLDTPMSTWLGTGWTDTTPEQEEEIRLRHLLSMTGGLDDDFGFDAPPGTTWYYNNNAYHQVRKAVELVTGQDTGSVFQELLFGPAGMTDSRWEPRPDTTDATGWPISGLHSNARDLARFGEITLAGGTWDGHDFACDPDYWRAAWTASQDRNPSYGLLWWVFAGDRATVLGVRDGETAPPKKAFGGVELPRPLAPNAPRDTVSAAGFGDQRVHVVPSLDLVVVRLGGPVRDASMPGRTVDDKLWHRLGPVLEER